MRRIAVYVATTGGPVRVQRITPERAPQSMVCLRRTSNRLAVSGAYDDFVRPGSGVIDREFGPFESTSFRLDVSDTIDSGGDSWQLGVFIAHAIAASEDCELGDENSDAIVWLTGRVDYDLKVGAVAHIPEKTTSSANEFERWRKAGVPVTLFVPDGENYDAVTRSDLTHGFEVVAAKDAREVCRQLGLDRAANEFVTLPRPFAVTASSDDMASDTRRRTSKRWAVPAALILVLIVTAGIGAGSPEARLYASIWLAQLATLAGIAPKHEFAQTGAAPKAPVSVALKPSETGVATRTSPEPERVITTGAVLKLRVLERRPPPGRNCADVHFGGVEAVLEPVGRDQQGLYLDSKSTSLCGLAFEVAPGRPKKYAGLVLKVRSGKMLNSEKSLPSALKGTRLLSSTVSWSIVLPGRMRAPFSYDLFLIESDRPVEKAARRLRDQPVTAAVLQTVAEEGKIVTRIAHKVMN